MNKTELENRIDELEKNRYYLSYKDRWDSKDYDNDFNWRQEINELKKQLAEL